MADYAVLDLEFDFVSDGTSTTLLRDLTLQPVMATFAGTPPQSLLNPRVTANPTVTIPTVTATISGTVISLVFATPPPEFDVNSVRVVYTAIFGVLL